MDADINDQLVLISGESASGKSASLMNIRNQERWIYLNCEAGKRLPFRNKFHTEIITDPYQIYAVFDALRPGGELEHHFDGVIVDTVTFLMDMFESLYIVNSANSQKAWGDYAQFFKTLMQQHVASSQKAVVMLGHTRTEYDEAAMMNRTSVPVKGSLKNNGIESYFSTVVSTKKVPIKTLESDQYKGNSLLHISDRDRMLGYKHVFQTQLTKETVGERIRSPLMMFSDAETFMDNDAQALLDHLGEYYGTSAAA